MRITPEIITELGVDDFFVFGSNEAGIHGAGAALIASKKFGARFMQGSGVMGKCYAIPTKDWDIEVLPLDAIGHYVKRFIAFAKVKEFKSSRFLVTPIGCGLAGYQPWQIAPLFRECLDMENVWLPESFIKVLEPTRLTSYDGANLDYSPGDSIGYTPKA